MAFLSPVAAQRGVKLGNESGNLPADIFLVALVLAAVVGVGVVLALLGHILDFWIYFLF